MATIDYMVAAYGPYSASATGGNGFARDFLAGIAAMYSTPSKYMPGSRFVSNSSVFHNIGDRPIQYASTVLACLAVVVTFPIYIFYWRGPTIRKKSKFAQVLASDLKAGIAAANNQSVDAAMGEDQESDDTAMEKGRSGDLEAHTEKKEHVDP
jgi:hypothetical protein